MLVTWLHHATVITASLTTLFIVWLSNTHRAVLGDASARHVVWAGSGSIWTHLVGTIQLRFLEWSVHEWSVLQ